MDTRRVDAFFYGLFMDEGVLREAGVDPAHFRRGQVDGFALRIGQRATLVPSEGARAHGMLVALSHADLERLYAAPGLEAYRPEAVIARTDDGKAVPALCYNLLQPPEPGEQNADYALRLGGVLARLGFPQGYVESVTRNCGPAGDTPASAQNGNRSRAGKMNHQVSAADRQFREAFESFGVTAEEFDHRAHVRLAYVYLCETAPVEAAGRMKQALLAFLDHLGVDHGKFHETLTGAWIDAVNHFMARSEDCADFNEFIRLNPALLDSKIMLSHYSAALLFSNEARASYVEPDIEPIPRH